MAEIEESLNNAGLSKIEVDTYLTTLTNGPISAGRVAKLTHNYRANVYQSIERLKSKGFISEIQGKKSKLFEASSPNHILNEFDKKKEALEKIIPALNQMKSTSIETTSMRIIEGVNGWRHLLDEFIEVGKERVVYGIPKEVEMLKDFFKEYHRKRAQRKIGLRHLFNYDAKERIKITNKLPYTQSKYLPEELDQPVSTSICGHLVALTVYQGKNILTIVIENQIIADAYRKYFEYLWKKC
jgi:HTH-type transcriptional regulator, sugar sensing transcriptional regulator